MVSKLISDSSFVGDSREAPLLRPLHLLLVEDSRDDAELLLRQLRRSGLEVECDWVDSLEEFSARLVERRWDVILSDFHLSGFGAMEVISALEGSGLDVPLIIISGTIGEEAAVEALKAGASDFVVKGRLARLVPAIERELREARMRRERREAEVALRASEEKYRSIVETAQEGIWTTDVENRITFANGRLTELLGLPVQVLLGRSMYDFVHPGDRQEARRRFGSAEDGNVERFELRLQRHEGGSFWASISWRARRDDEGTYLGALGMVTDITERRTLQAHVMMSDRLASVGMLAAGVAHEINNPLAAVLANVDLALRDVSSEEAGFGSSSILRDLREELEDAHEAAERVRQIVRDLRIFSRSEESSLATIDLKAVLESTLRMAWNEIRHRARLRKSYDAVPAVCGNDSRLGQVFLNLIVNAAQAIPEGDFHGNEIHVRTYTDENGWAVVEITDTGLGMPEQVVRQLFMPFFTTKPPGVGTGLGLSISHRIIEGFGGTIAVDSEVGTGSTFRVLLPPSSSVEENSSGPPEETPSPAIRRRVLVVDDDIMVVRAARRILARDHDVVAVASARDALELLMRGVPFDVILCDLMMPDMTGMQFHAEMESLDAELAQRIVFCTGGAFTPGAQAFLSRVGNAHIEKPFDVAALCSAIQRCTE